MSIHFKPILIMAVVLFVFNFMQSCKPKPSENVESNLTERGEPVLLIDNPIFDESSQSFSLTLYADSTSGAVVTFFLFDGDSLIMQSSDGLFKSISPLEEGYNVQARVEWDDTTIITPVIHVVGFVVPREPVEKLSAEELQNLIIAREKTVIETHLAQRVKLTVHDCQENPSLLHDVFLYLENKVWDSVNVVDVTYDENNLIIGITLKAVVKTVPQPDDDDEFYDVY